MDKVGLDVVLDIEEHYAATKGHVSEGPRGLLRRYVQEDGSARRPAGASTTTTSNTSFGPCSPWRSIPLLGLMQGLASAVPPHY